MNTTNKIKTIFIFLAIIGFFFSSENIRFYDGDIVLHISAGTGFYSESPANTDVSMLNGSFDNSDNMKINDDSNAGFTSTVGVAIPDEYADSLTIVSGTYVSGTVADTRVDNGVAYVLSGLYITRVNFNFNPALAGRNFYISGHFETTGGSGALWVNGASWKVSTNIDFDNELYNGVNSIYYATGGMSTHQSRTFYLKLVEVGTPTPAVINYTIEVDFSEIQGESLLGLNVSSYHYTNVSSVIEGNIYNFSSSSYNEMFSSDNTVETHNLFMDNTNVGDYLNGTGFIKIQFKGVNPNSFLVLMDYIVITFNYTDFGNPPTWDNLTESGDPLELGFNETITINVYSENIIIHVYLEFGNSNHSMQTENNETWVFEWLPTESGMLPYTIWMIDNYNLTSSMQGDITIFNTPLIGMGSLFLVILMVGMLFFYLKYRTFLIVLVIFLFSIVVGTSAMGIPFFPFTPYFQLFFLMFQTSIFIMTTINFNEERKRNER